MSPRDSATTETSSSSSSSGCSTPSCGSIWTPSPSPSNRNVVCARALFFRVTSRKYFLPRSIVPVKSIMGGARLTSHCFPTPSTLILTISWSAPLMLPATDLSTLSCRNRE